MTWLILFAMQAAVPELPPLHGGPAPMTCPVGGERFSAFQAGTWSTFGERPDGKPYSYLPLPFPLPECPTNKLVVFDDFTPDEVARLPALLATPEYRALQGTDTPYYRASWLAARLGRPVTQRLWLLLTAGWQVKGGDKAGAARPALAQRYNEEFARGVAALPANTDAKELSALRARGANALRELGRFDAAGTMLHKAREALARRTDGDGGWTAYLDTLAKVIARRDTSIEPLDAIPPRQAAARCRSGDPVLLASERTLCALPNIANAR